MTCKHLNANKKLKNANKIFFCDFCNVNFKHYSSFCRHKKICQTIFLEEEKCELENDIQDKDALIIQLLKQNGELQNR